MREKLTQAKLTPGQVNNWDYSFYQWLANYPEKLAKQLMAWKVLIDKTKHIVIIWASKIVFCFLLLTRLMMPGGYTG